MSNDPPGLDLARLAGHLAEHAPELAGAGGPLRAERVVGGKSNLTYIVTTPDREFVVRRPPLGHVLATAHDMSREFRVMTALGPTDVPVPRTFLLCADVAVLGAPFYVMERVHGTVYRGVVETATLTADRAVGISFELMDTLALLHDVDPAAVGLGDFGRPDGYLDRQLKRWKMQLDASRSRDLAGIDKLHGELGRSIPRGTAAIVHGDYRLDNVIVDGADRVAAVLDWEMCTLGDPLADLGLLLVYWDRLSATPRASLPNAIAPGVGFPSGEQIIARYASRRDVDLSRLSWYVAFGFFKLAVIAEGIYYRYQHGQTVGAGFENMGETVAPLVAQGLAELGRA